MDFTLVPICTFSEHELEYDYKEGYKCDICDKHNVSYRCINCEYSRCSKCHRNILGEQEIKRIEVEETNMQKYKSLLKLYDQADIINDLI